VELWRALESKRGGPAIQRICVVSGSGLRRWPMDCVEFLEGYSSFLDGEFDECHCNEYRRHLRSCNDCAEYDRVVRRGLLLVRELDPPNTAPDFMPRLQRSFLSQSQASRAGDYVWLGGITGLALAGLVLVFSVPALRPGGGVPELPPVIVEASEQRSGMHSLWGPPPRFAPSASFLTAPSFSSEPRLLQPSQPLSIFREPVGTPMVRRASSGLPRLDLGSGEMAPE
jgi:hypothetical protein